MKFVSDALRDVIYIALFIAVVMIGTAFYKHYQDTARLVSLQKRIQTYGKLIVPIRLSEDQSVGFTVGTGELIRLPSHQTAILTNAHVCHAATQSKLWVSTIIDGQPVYDLKVMKISAIPDLCLYYSPAILNMRAFVVKSTQPTYGEELLEIGFPLNGPQTPTVGLYLYGNPDSQIAMKLSDADGCIGGEVVMSVFCVVTEDLQVTTVTTYPGNSGSPVFNEAGQMIGIMNSADNKTNYGQYVAGKYIQEFIRGL